jgi:hypothetical protein
MITPIQEQIASCWQSGSQMKAHDFQRLVAAGPSPPAAEDIA